MRTLIPLVLTACIADPRASLEGEDAASDAAPTPDALTPDASPNTRCEPVVETFATDGFEEHEPVIGGDLVFAHRRDSNGILRAVHVVDGAPAGGPTDRIMDAEGAARLLLRLDGAGTFRLIYRQDGTDTPLGDFGRANLGEPDPGLAHGREPRRLVEPGGAAWVANDAIHALRNGRAGPIWLGPAHGIGIADGLIAWVQSLEDEVRVAPVNLEAHTIGPADQTPSVVPTRGHVWWLAGGRPHLWRTGEAAGRVVSALTDCHDLDADGPEALVVCGDARSQVLSRVTADGAATELDRGPLILAPRAAHGALAWARYNDPEAWCSTLTPGTLWWQPAGAPEPLAVAEVGAGCGCCGAYWPPLQIDLGRDRVAWNYAGEHPEARIGVATCR